MVLIFLRLAFSGERFQEFGSCQTSHSADYSQWPSSAKRSCRRQIELRHEVHHITGLPLAIFLPQPLSAFGTFVQEHPLATGEPQASIDEVVTTPFWNRCDTWAMNRANSKGCANLERSQR
ncbi:hypothetical protein BCCGELA001_30570 [Bradyrhizobium sp. CCGE-LA001]|nr:hypothetical protein BCCGELA001_30570 [Bradyrhizobium sp. CCGE-LA001]